MNPYRSPASSDELNTPVEETSRVLRTVARIWGVSFACSFLGQIVLVPLLAWALGGKVLSVFTYPGLVIVTVFKYLFFREQQWSLMFGALVLGPATSLVLYSSLVASCAAFLFYRHDTKPHIASGSKASLPLALIILDGGVRDSAGGTGSASDQ